MRYGLCFIVFGVMLAVLGVQHGTGWLALLWPSLSMTAVGLGYVGIGPAIYGKRADGRLPASRVIPLLPFLLFTWGIWRLLRLIRSEDAYNDLGHGILIGRRVYGHELPDTVRTVVDLTAEFYEPRAVREGRNYLARPILDAYVPRTEDLVALAQELAATESPVYIHCAEGHGRNGLVASALLVAHGRADSAADALAQVQHVRPDVKLTAPQRRVLAEAAAMLQTPTAP
jgi:protein-tyrosine phosphatase